jgi:thioredoxin-like negative regulator of GroEL
MVPKIKNLKRMLQEVNVQGLVFVYIYTEWNEDCMIVSDTMDELQEEYSGALFYKVDKDEVREVSQYGITSVPAFLMFKDGHKLGHLQETSVLVIREALTNACERYG